MKSIPAEIAELLEQLKSKMDALHAAVHGPYPDLDLDPTSDAEVHQVFNDAETWGRRVRDLYGFPWLGDPEGSIAEIFGQRPPLKLRKVYGEMIPIRDVPDYPHRRLGSFLSFIPEQFDLEFNVVFQQEMGGATPSFMREGRWHVEANVQNWEQVRDHLAGCYFLIRFRALGLISWIRERVCEFETQMVPRLKKLRDLERNKVAIEVTLSGGSREVVITGSASDFLLRLGKDGKAKASRKVLGEVRERVPELRDWIERHVTVEDNYAWYKIANLARAGLQALSAQ
ncbi:MAG: hypothetical protein IPN34_20890 [Planctomycetes bacterium]|nr:hypothetical protein [Planctomycetota bacterium]